MLLKDYRVKPGNDGGGLDNGRGMAFCGNDRWGFAQQ